MKCPECKKSINKILSEKKIVSNKKFKQEQIDIKSIKTINNNVKINYALLPINLIKFISVINKLIISTSKTDIVELKNECFENINKQNNPKVFNILQRFRQQKLFGNQMKYNAIDEVSRWIF
jgi:hypothetical protein